MKLSNDFVLTSFTILVHVVSINADYGDDNLDNLYNDHFQPRNRRKASLIGKTTISIQFTNQYNMQDRDRVSCHSANLTGGKNTSINKHFINNDCEPWRKGRYDDRQCKDSHEENNLEICTNYTITFKCTIKKTPDIFISRHQQGYETEITRSFSIITSYFPPLLPVYNIEPTFHPTKLSSYLNISWEEPYDHKLCVKLYRINANSSIHGEKNYTTEFSTFILTTLKPGENYTGIVYAADENGTESKGRPFEFTTPDDYVKPNLTVSAESQVNREMDVSWKCDLQYPVDKYLVEYWPNNTDEKKQKEVHKLTTTISSLEPCIYYKVRVAPKLLKAENDMFNEIDVFIVSSDTCMITTKDLVLLYEFKVIYNGDKTDQIILNIPNGLFVRYTEVITNYSITICIDNEDTKNVDLNTSTTNNWADAQLDSSILCYRTTPNNWNPFKDDKEPPYAQYIIGEGSCTEDRTVYCNGPLKSSQGYKLILKVCSKYGCINMKGLGFHTQTPKLPDQSSINDGNQINQWQYIGLIFTVLLICAGIYYILRATSDEDGVMDAIMKSMPSDMTLEELISKTIEDMEIEYNLLDVFLKSNPSTNVAMLSKNRPKNRYSDILPYDFNRVELKWGNNDYINASLIHDSEGALKYIACQGPMPNTCVDMWQMVLEQNVVSIVMLCKLVENDKIKCDKYFPDANEQTQYDDIKVRNNNMVVNELNSFTVSELTITKGNTQKMINHFQYHDWPDFGTPENYTTLMEFCDNVNKASTNGLTVVHCSAGVGRTGTYIACDLLKKTINRGEKLNVFKTVLNLRKQRTNMVQTQDQYNFIYGYLGSFGCSSD